MTLETRAKASKAKLGTKLSEEQKSIIRQRRPLFKESFFNAQKKKAKAVMSIDENGVITEFRSMHQAEESGHYRHHVLESIKTGTRHHKLWWEWNK